MYVAHAMRDTWQACRSRTRASHGSGTTMSWLKYSTTIPSPWCHSCDECSQAFRYSATGKAWEIINKFELEAIVEAMYAFRD